MKPIPPNRRWNGESDDTSEPPANSIRDLLPGLLDAILVCRFDPPQTLEIANPGEAAEARVSVLATPAHYRTTCRACFQPIQVGDPIVRHAQAGCWVHQACYDRPLQPTTRPLVVAQYDGYCRICREGIRAGELITRVQGRGWVHAHCAED